ncbi:hypothetical protein MPNT_400016 [Candidatus Methylacidithermus pantelleriae]|uniref:Uncharacterized protein n=1 Tax=Candidatus Methylacidithermus pantelleriae TaxID=2744239 RepID=A0A8J2BV79_9BACT|nr:hypothetical protein MPNT_400016 [Candidatus Methylacidithermus pantelleriae]
MGRAELSKEFALVAHSLGRGPETVVLSCSFAYEKVLRKMRQEWRNLL